MFAEYNITILY